MKRSRLVAGALTLALLSPSLIGAALATQAEWPDSWRTAKWASSGLLPPPSSEAAASARVLCARTGRWKSVFADHCWIVLKDEAAAAYERYEVVGWGRPVRLNAYAADGFWYSNEPRVVYVATGLTAATALTDIRRAIAAYPHSQRGSYSVWPGPNSNSFVAEIARRVEGFDPVLPNTAIGKDYLATAQLFDETPSNTGWQVSLAGIAGVTLAREEGVELNFLGLVWGIGSDGTVKLPVVGDVHFST